MRENGVLHGTRDDVNNSSCRRRGSSGQRIKDVLCTAVRSHGWPKNTMTDCHSFYTIIDFS